LTQGLGSADLRRKMEVQTLHHKDGPARDDPLGDALETRKRLLADKVLSRTINEVEGEDLKAQVERKRSEMELQKLEVERKAPQESLVGQLAQEVQTLHRQIAENQQKMTEAQLQEIRTSITALFEEFDKMKQPQGSQIEVVKQQLEQAQALVDLVTPVDTPPSTGGDDRILTAYIEKLKRDDKRADLEFQRWQIEHTDQHAVALAEVRARQEQGERELQIKEAHYERMDRFFAETAPKVELLLGNVVAALRAGMAQAPPDARAATAPNLAEGVSVATCNVCGAPMYYRDGQSWVICSCGAEYELKPTEGTPTETPDENSDLEDRRYV
jgi:hypothetical protein